MTPLDRRALILYLCVAVSLAFVDHRVRREKYREHTVTEYIPSVIAGTSGAPAKYRVLMPYALDGIAKRTGGDPYTVFLVSEIVSIIAALFIAHAYLRQWFGPGASTGGTLALAAMIPLAFTNTWAHPDTFPDLALFTAGCLAIASRRDLILAAILLIGMFNRETTGFLALLWGVDRMPEWRRGPTIRMAVLLFGICLAVYVGLRWTRGFEHYEMWMVPKNLEYSRVLPPGFDPFTRIAGFFWIVLLVVPGWFALEGARRSEAPRFFGSAWAIALLFVVVAWLFAAIIETRVFVPALPLLLPGAVAAFITPRAASEGGGPLNANRVSVVSRPGDTG
jgi:hypothetical protein